MEYLKKSPRLQHVPRDIPQDKEALFLQRLDIIVSFTGRPVTRRNRNQSVDF
ncbi:Uncharacterised protein [Klebsiella pneumoniae]|uniref:Uncharacterized protein n=1 Tax=Klebsiella pneumoniae TaxID=573 RepID=A0A378FXB1_KLEPN|nr:Uncharacterised protein [Klebsiella pneumoniae]